MYVCICMLASIRMAVCKSVSRLSFHRAVSLLVLSFACLGATLYVCVPVCLVCSVHLSVCFCLAVSVYLSIIYILVRYLAVERDYKKIP